MDLGRWKLRCAAVVSLLLLVCGASAHAQDNLRSGEKINGYTGEVFDTRNYPYDYLVDSSLPQEDPANHKFKTLQAAYAAAPEGTEQKRTVIGIKPDVYFLPGEPSAPASLTITKNYITLLGLTNDRRNVVLADNRGNKEGATNNGYILDVNANGFTMMNLTLVNYCNMDYEYPGNPAKNLKMRSPVITQAVALQVQGDKHVYSHVAVLSRLDTMFIRTTRSYFTHAYTEGTDDFLGGGQVSVFEDSEIYFPTGGGVMSASGITFIRTVFKASHGLQFYKGFRNPDTLIDCVLPVNSPTSRVAWMVWKAPVRQNLFSLTYHNKDASGKPAVIMDSAEQAPAFTLSRELSAEEVKAFNPWNLLRATPTGPVDDWDPANARAKYEKLGSEVFRMGMTGHAAGAQSEGDGPFTSPAVSPSIRTGDAGATLGVDVAPARLKDAAITWSSTSGLVKLSSTSGSSITVTGSNTTDHAQYVPVRATAPNGFYVVSYVYVEPKYIDPPAFTAKPTIAAPAGGKLDVRYGLKLDGKDDQSLISWYQCVDAQCSSSREVAVSRGDQPLRAYTLTPGDVGMYMKAVIRPKHNISDPGPEVSAVSTKSVAASDLKSSTVSPNFRNFVPTPNDTYTNGMWTVIGMWTPVTGENLVNGYGLRISSAPTTRNANGVQTSRPPLPHAELLYQGAGPVSDMQVKVVMSPEKTAGQGFGIAGSPNDDDPRAQRADIFIKYDPRTKTGYSLRFWRTIQAADKCMFQIYKIVDGKGTPLSDQQELTGVFKPETTITLTVTGTKLTVKGSNTVDQETLSLEGTITPNDFGGTGLFWSGSVPVGNSNVVSEFEISYPKGKS